MLIKKYTSEWVENFERLKQNIEYGLLDIECDIEHVGSTSVPLLDSKPIIDIDIIFSRQPDFNKLKSQLEKLGYYHNGNQGIEPEGNRAVTPLEKQFDSWYITE